MWKRTLRGPVQAREGWERRKWALAGSQCSFQINTEKRTTPLAIIWVFCRTQ